ncbi:MAG TPA: ribosome silencing factor [Myxococcaceae bacterium]|nr:ribosome silencing factor [Myxococcaceae bacterium]
MSPAKSKTKRPRPAASRAAARKRPARRSGAPALTQPRAENPEALALARRAATLLVDRKATEVVLLDVRGMSSYADYFVIASGDSERGVIATAEHVRETLKNAGHRTIGTEGFETGHWVLLDFGEVVVHVFFTEVRAFYDLDGLWADAPKEKVA